MNITRQTPHRPVLVFEGGVPGCNFDRNGALKISATDNTFSAPGKVGLWTKADSVTYFDDLEVAAP
jgi:hypothetical protein